MLSCCHQSTSKMEVFPNAIVPTTPERKKHPRDLPFLILFALMLVGMLYLGSFSIQKGDVGRYIFGVDSWGNVCGREVNTPIPNATHSGLDHSKRPYEFQVVLSNMQMVLNPLDILLKTNAPATLCIKTCPRNATDCDRLLLDNGYNLSDIVIQERVCTMPFGLILPHHPLINRCIPSQIMQFGSFLVNSVNQFSNTGVVAQHFPLRNVTNATSNNTGLQTLASLVTGQIINSSLKYWKDTIYLCMIALGVSFAMIVFLQLFYRALVVILVFLSSLGSLSFTAFMWYNYAVAIGAVNEADAKHLLQTKLLPTVLVAAGNNYSAAATNLTAFNTGQLLDMLTFTAIRESNYLLPASVAVTIATVIILAVLIWSRKSLLLVASLFEEASLSVFSMPGMLLQPFITLSLMLLATVYFFIVGSYILSIRTANVDNHGMVRFVEDPATPQVLLALPHLFCWLWIMQFFSGCQKVILASAVSRWFFTRGAKLKKCHLNLCPTCADTRDLILYNLGSVALGSFIVALVQFIRIILAYLERKLKKSKNKTAIYVMKCVLCCMACFEKVLKYVTRNAYICVAMYGDGFCSGAKHAFHLLLSNAKHVMLLNCISGFCLFLGKVSVVIITGFAGYSWFRTKLGPTAPQAEFIVPVTIACFLSFLIATSFLNVYEIAIDTLFLCFCDDQQRNNGGDRPYYSTARLQRYMSGGAKKNKTMIKAALAKKSAKVIPSKSTTLPAVSQKSQLLA